MKTNSKNENRNILKQTLIIAIAVITTLLLASCASDARKTRRLVRQGQYNCEERMAVAMERHERRRHSDALRIFEEVRFQCGGSPFLDTLYFHAAMSHLALRQFEDALFEFDFILREHPRSAFAEEARFRIAHMRFRRSLPSFRDQTTTKEAMTLLNDYLDVHPEGVWADSAKTLYMISLNRLAEKDFNTARFYRRQRQHEAALVYYRSVLADFPDSDFASESIVGMAEMLVALGRVEDAQETVEQIDDRFWDQGLKDRVEALKRSLSI